MEESSVGEELPISRSRSNINKSNFSFPNVSGGAGTNHNVEPGAGTIFPKMSGKTAPVRVFLPAFEPDKELRQRTLNPVMLVVSRM
jgi:hypothetical protein